MRRGGLLGRAPALDPRRVAQVLWAVLVLFLLLFLAMVLAVETGREDGPHRHFLLVLVGLASGFGIGLAREMPDRIPARQAGHRPGANALVRLLVGWSIGEAAAILPVVVHAVSHDHRLLVVYAAGVLAQLALYPSADLWARLSADLAGRSPGPGPEQRP